MNDLLSQASQILHTSGGRMTTQRRLILETLNAMGGHPTAEEVYQAVCAQDTSINPSTIYRTLGWLADAGLVSPRRLEMGPDDRRKERFDPASPVEHHHFVCTNCGRVIEFESPFVEHAKEEFVLRHQVTVERASLTLYGLCAECGETMER